MILYAAEFIFRLSLGFKAGKDKSHVIHRRSTNNAKLKTEQNKSLTCYTRRIIPPKAQIAVQNIQASGPFVLLYQLDPKRCVLLEAGHMLLSDGGLFFSEFADEDIHPQRLRACLLVCMCGERASESERD